MNTEAALVIVLAIAMLWFMARWQFAPKGGRLSLGFFRREKRDTIPGLGPKAIRTLLDDTLAFIGQESAAGGLILAGPFASETAHAESTVTFIVPVADPSAFAGEEWLARWPYPARGHLIQARQSQGSTGLSSHRLALRGAPPIAFHFVDQKSEAPPGALREAFEAGAMALETGTTVAKMLIARWKAHPSN